LSIRSSLWLILISTSGALLLASVICHYFLFEALVVDAGMSGDKSEALINLSITVLLMIFLVASFARVSLFLYAGHQESGKSGREFALWKLKRLSKKYKTAAVGWIFAGRLLQIVSVVAGIIVSGIATQAAEFTALGLPQNTLIIVISGIGSSAAALLTQLRFEALARGREIARVGVESELFRARTMFSDHQLQGEEAKAMSDIRERIATIEYDQIDHVFPPQPGAEPQNEPNRAFGAQPQGAAA
jgi:hypothetical protein